jgi:hypothetical protein
MVAHHGGMDCHASLAMTWKRYLGNFHLPKRPALASQALLSVWDALQKDSRMLRCCVH